MTGSWTRIYAWAALLALPYLYLGWVLGRVGFVLDDWAVWRAVTLDRWLAMDNLRPLAVYPIALLHALAGNNLVLIFGLLLLVHGISAILFYETVRRLFARGGLPDAPFFAFIAAAIFVLYPSDVSRLWLLPSFGSRWVCMEACGVALLAITALEKNRPLLFAGAMLVAASALARVESNIAVFAAIPLLAVVYDRARERKWIALSAVWYAALVAYVVWHFHVTPQWQWGRFGSQSLEIRPLVIPGVLQFFAHVYASFYEMTAGTISYAVSEALSAGPVVNMLRAAIVGTAIGAAVILAAWAVYFRERSAGARALSSRGWLGGLGVAAVFAVAGMLPYMVNGENQSGVVIVTGILARYSAVAAMGVSAVLVYLTCIPLGGPFRNARFRAAAAALLGVAVLAVAYVRLTYTANDYVAAWSIQKTEWRAILTRNGYFSAGSAIMYHNFPVYVRAAPMANQSWSIRNALAQLLQPPPVSAIYVTTNPSDMRIYPDNAGETADWRVEGTHVTTKWYLPHRLSFPIEDFVVLDYDRKTNTIHAMTSFPLDDLSGPRRGVPLYTGRNVMMPLRRFTPLAESYFSPIATNVCTDVVAVTAPGRMEAGGAAVVTQDGVIAERRFVEKNDGVHFSFYARCGARESLFLVPAQRAGTGAALPAAADRVPGASFVRLKAPRTS